MSIHIFRSHNHDVISYHSAPSWLILQICLTVYNKVVLSIYYFIFKVLCKLYSHIGSIGSEKKPYFVVAICSKINRDMFQETKVSFLVLF